MTTAKTLHMPAPAHAAPPYSQEAEEALIGAVLNRNREYYGLNLESHEMYLLRHEYIWQAISICMREFKSADVVTVCEKLSTAGHLDLIGGEYYLRGLMDSMYDAYNAPVYAHIIKTCANRRALLQAADNIKVLALDEEQTNESVNQEAQALILQATSIGIKRRDVSLKSVVLSESNRMDAIIEAYQRGEAVFTGLPTGFKDLDGVLDGLKGSDLLIFAGRPGMGKSAFITSMLLLLCRMKLAFPGGFRLPRIGVFTLEMSKEQYQRRLLAALADIPIQKLFKPYLMTAEENYRRISCEGVLGDMLIELDDTPQTTPEYVMQTSMRWAMEGDLDLIVVDHLARMASSPSIKTQDNRNLVLGDIGVKMKTLARELNTPVWAAHQLSRKVEGRADKRPVMSDLRDSGVLEQEADVIMFLYRDSVYNEATEHPNLADVIIAKHRNGPTGTVSLYFNKHLARFEGGETRRINLDNL